MPSVNPQPSIVNRLAAEHGFALNGIALIPEDGQAPGAEALRAWLAGGLHGPLEYMERTAAARMNVRVRFPWAKAILALGAFYSAERPAAADDFSRHVARYAQGRDYHRIFEKRLKRLSCALLEAKVCTRAHRYTDTGPVLERAWAERAGLGWIGKNTCLIHPKLGSYMLLAELLLDTVPPEGRGAGVRGPESGNGVNADLAEPFHCGTCTRCLDACPTQALVRPGVLDARRCLSTWNIERDGATPEALWAAQGDWAAGCDICQEVCPFNAPRRATARDAELAQPLSWKQLTVSACIGLTAWQFDAAFPGSPLRRTGLKGVRLGAITVAGNLKLSSCRAALEACAADPDPEIRARAAWAQSRCAAAGF